MREYNTSELVEVCRETSDVRNKERCLAYMKQMKDFVLMNALILYDPILSVAYADILLL